MNQSRPLKVKLIGQPMYPMGTLFYVWEQSRTNDPVPEPAQLEEVLNYDGPRWVRATDSFALVCSQLKAPQNAEVVIELERFDDIEMHMQMKAGEAVDAWAVRDRLKQTILEIMSEDIPVAENLHFVFSIENMSITLREQMVRHRIGVQVGERLGVDMVPDLGKSSWWSQTMRQLPMDRFAEEKRYIIPDSLEGKSVKCDAFPLGDWNSTEFLVGNMSFVTQEIPAEELYRSCMDQIQATYKKLLEAGVPLEDARSVIPVGATHSITWCLNLKAIKTIVGKRACWVLQASLWEEMIAGMVSELAQVSPLFGNLALPPCFKRGKFSSCPFHQINKERVQGRDNNPPCPLHVKHENQLAVQSSRMSQHDSGQDATWSPPPTGSTDLREWESSSPVEFELMVKSAERFARLWRLDVFTGEAVRS